MSLMGRVQTLVNYDITLWGSFFAAFFVVTGRLSVGRHGMGGFDVAKNECR